MQLSELFQALYYLLVPPSALQGDKDDLRDLLFPHSDPRDSFFVNDSGHITYTAIRNDLYCAPQSAEKAIECCKKWQATTNEKWAKRHKSGILNGVEIFPSYLKLLPNVVPHYTQDLNGNPALDYWILTFQIELQALRVKKGTPLLEAASTLSHYQSPFGTHSEQGQSAEIQRLLEIGRKISRSILEGEYLRVHIGENGWVVGMDYHHGLLYPNPQPSDLYTIAPQKTGTQAVETFPNFVGERRNGFAVSVFAGSREANCKEGVGGENFTSPFEKYCKKSIQIFCVIQPNTLSNSSFIKIKGIEMTETDILKNEIEEIFTNNHIKSTIEFVDDTQLDALHAAGSLGARDFILILLNYSIDPYGITLTGGENPKGKLTSGSSADCFPEASCLVNFPKISEDCRPIEGKVKRYKLKNDASFIERLAHTCVHELYHAIIDRSLRWFAFNEVENRKSYPYGEVNTPEVNKFINRIFKNHFDKFGHQMLDSRISFDERKELYSINIPYLSTYAHVISPYEYENKKIPIVEEYQIIDLFLLNTEVDFIEFMKNEEDGISFPKEMEHIINNKKIKQGISRNKTFLFREDLQELINDFFKATKD